MQEYVSSQTSEGSLGFVVSNALLLAGAALRTGIHLLRYRAMWCAEKTGRYDAMEGVFKEAYPREAMDGLAPHMPAGYVGVNSMPNLLLVGRSKRQSRFGWG